MSLDTLSCAQQLTTHLSKACGLGADGLPEKGKPADNSSWPDDFASAYNDYAMGGEVLGTVNEGGDKSVLSSFMEGAEGSTPLEFAQAIADFWSGVALEPGIPFDGAISVDEVVENNALTLVAPIQAAIMASMTDQLDGPPYFKTLLDNIQAVITGQMLWTVIQTHPGTPPYTVTHSVNIV